MSFKQTNNKTIFGAIINTTVAAYTAVNAVSTELTSTYGIGSFDEAKSVDKRVTQWTQSTFSTLETKLESAYKVYFERKYDGKKTKLISIKISKLESKLYVQFGSEERAKSVRKSVKRSMKALSKKYSKL